MPAYCMTIGVTCCRAGEIATATPKSNWTPRGAMRKISPKRRLERLLESGKLSPKQALEAIKTLRQWDDADKDAAKPKSVNSQPNEYVRHVLSQPLDKPLSDAESQPKPPARHAPALSEKRTTGELAYRDDAAKKKFHSLLSEGHKVFHYSLLDGRIVDEDMHDCEIHTPDSAIPKIEVSKQPEWRMVLRVSDGELGWFHRKDAPKRLVEPMGGETLTLRSGGKIAI